MAAMFQVDSLHFAENIELIFAFQLVYSVSASEFKMFYSHFHVRDKLYFLVFCTYKAYIIVLVKLLMLEKHKVVDVSIQNIILFMKLETLYQSTIYLLIL